MTAPPPDARQRELALDITRSFCVQAPAGSGKTELLTQRLLKLLANVEQPEEVLAFTFTRKAAAEMRRRLLDSLQSARERLANASFDPATLAPHEALTQALAAAVLEHDARCGWQLLDNSKRLRLGTIDSFTASLAGQLPLSANFGARPNVTTDVSAMQRRAVRSLLDGLDRQDALGAALRQLLPQVQNNLGKAERLLMALLGRREQWLGAMVRFGEQAEQARPLLEASLVELIDAELSPVLAALRPYADALRKLIRYAAGNLPATASADLQALAALPDLPPAEASALSHWKTLARFLVTSEAASFRSHRGLQGKHGFPSKNEARNTTEANDASAHKLWFGELVAALQQAGCLPLLQTVHYLPPAQYDERQWQVLCAVATLLPQLAARLDVAMREAGQVDHTENSLAAQRALGKLGAPSELAQRLDARIRHLLVDEFQDTSLLQYQLLRLLTADWTDGDGRTLFVVGDGMQSCYAFRNAKVGLFLQLRHRGLGALRPQPLELQVNFRSDASIVNWVNRVFATAFPQQDDPARGGVRYSASVARRPEPVAPGVQVQLWQDADGSQSTPAQRRSVEAEHIADLCERWQREQPGASLAILVRTRSQLVRIAPALRARGLRWSASKLDTLLSYPDIRDLFTLLRALLSLADTTAWLALLRTPFIGLALADLQILAGWSRMARRSIWSAMQRWESCADLSEDARCRLRRCVPVLYRARGQRQRLPLRSLLEILWIELGGPQSLLDPRILANVAGFLDLVEQSERCGELEDIHAFERALQQSHGSTVDPGVNLHVMTIHNAKGLEFDGVILPALDLKPRTSDKPLLHLRDDLDPRGERLPLLGLMPPSGSVDALYDYLDFESKQRERFETTRLLYIGVTRAARACYLFGHVSQGKQGLQAPKSSLLAEIVSTLQEPGMPGQVRIDVLPTVTAPVSAASTSIPRVQSWRRLPAAWEPPPSLPVVPVATAAPPSDPDHYNLLARCSGELVHAGLRALVEQGSDWLTPTVELPLWRSRLRPLCADASALARACSQVRRQLLRCLEDAETGWLFRAPQQEDHCEWALIDWREGPRRDHVIDRTFIAANGERWIIDYKSSAPAAGQGLADFVAEQEAKYRAQLLRYRALFESEGRRIRCALLFTPLPLLHELALP
jgi:ATP-dependent helicase/nuclease subunit A